MSGTPWDTSAPTCTRATCGCAASTCSTRWATTPSVCPPSSSPSSTAVTRARRSTRTSRRCGANCGRSASGTTLDAPSQRPMLRTTGGRNGSSCRSSTRGSTTIADARDRPPKQWKLAITAYGDRLLEDLELLDWPESIKTMQRNWIGRSVGADVDFPVAGHEDAMITVFTTRPDTLFGATYMVLAPEHPLVDEITASEWPDATLVADLGDMPEAWKGIFGIDVLPVEAVRRYREFAEQKSELERQAEGREKTGVFTGAFAVNPTTGDTIPIFVADYVLMGCGTGAIMAVA